MSPLLDRRLVGKDFAEAGDFAAKVAHSLTILLSTDDKRRLIETYGTPPEPKADPEGYSYWISTALPSPPPMKDKLFQLQDTRARLGQIQMLIELYQDKNSETANSREGPREGPSHS